MLGNNKDKKQNELGVHPASEGAVEPYDHGAVFGCGLANAQSFTPIQSNLYCKNTADRTQLTGKENLKKTRKSQL